MKYLGIKKAEFCYNKQKTAAPQDKQTPHTHPNKSLTVPRHPETFWVLRNSLLYTDLCFITVLRRGQSKKMNMFVLVDTGKAEIEHVA